MKKSLIFSLLFAVVQAPVEAGQGTGNGGYGYVCRDAQNRVSSARLLDLWEPETFTAFKDDSVGVSEQISGALEKVGKFFPEGQTLLREQVDLDSKRTFFTNRNLPFTQDAIPRYAPDTGCNYEQIARQGFNVEKESFILEINAGIFQNASFSNTDKAALFVHEALYFLARRNLNLETSNEVRFLIGKLFSNEQLTLKDKRSLIQMISGRDSSAEIVIATEASDSSEVSNGAFTSYEAAKKKFRSMKETTLLENPEARAAAIVKSLTAGNVRSKKLWIFFSKSYIRSYNFEWAYYVAPVVEKTENGSTVKLVMDTFYTNGPRLFKEWTDIFMQKDPDCTPIKKYSDLYKIEDTSTCYLLETASELVTLGDVMAQDWREQ